MSVTALEFVVLCLYAGGNVAILVLSRADRAGTAAMLAAINATPLFLGGRTNPLADSAGVPLSTYHVFHHFVGRLVIIEALVHSLLALQQAPAPARTTIPASIVRKRLPRIFSLQGQELTGAERPSVGC